jgi:hypothetical protein
MYPEPLQQIQDLYHSVHARKAEERAVFLTEVWGEDTELRREVESPLIQ